MSSRSSAMRGRRDRGADAKAALVVLGVIGLTAVCGSAVSSAAPPSQRGESPQGAERRGTPTQAQQTGGRFVLDGETITIPDDAASESGLETIVIEPRTAPQILRLTGRTGLNLDTVAHIHAQFPGRIVEAGPRLGDMVVGPDDPSGVATLLCRVESTDLAQAKSDYLKARTQAEQDQDALQRIQQLFEARVLSDKALFDARAAVRRSEADFDATRQRLLIFGLDDAQIAGVERQQGRERMVYEIRAPRSGVITEKTVTRGEYADPSANLFTIADTATLWVWGDVYERDWARIGVGQRMSVRVSADPGATRDCVIDWISPVIDGVTRSVRVRGSLDNHDRRLLADMYATLDVVTGSGEGSLLLPESALVRKPRGTFVLVRVRKTGDRAVYERRPVVVEAASVGHARVLRGVAAGETVVVKGALGLSTEIDQK